MAVAGANVFLLPDRQQTTSDVSGSFSFKNLNYGKYTLQITAQGKAMLNQDITLTQQLTELKEIILWPELHDAAEEIPTITLSENELEANPSGSNSVILNASRDAYISAASFNFSIARFRLRGYRDENAITFLNGVPMTDLVTGRNMYFLWSGLNDVFRNRESTYGLFSSNYAFGGAGGSSMIDSRASRQRKQLQATYSLSNRSYNNRVMLTYGSGIRKNGWSYALSGSKRWANEGYIPGTFYDGYSYFGTIEKLIGTRHSLSLTAFGVSSKNGRQAPAIQELYDLVGTNFYNPYWGYQNGKIRNSSVANNQNTSVVFLHEFKLNNLQWLTTSLAYIKNKRKITALNWYNAVNPMPDYYRNLPSFFEDNPSMQQQLIQLYSNNPTLLQINWDAIYEANYKSDTTLTNANGIPGNNISGKWSRYIIENRVTDNNAVNFNTYYNHIFSDKFTLTSGAGYQQQQTAIYKEVDDLLGGDFFVDLNMYAEMDNPGNNLVIQNDLNNPNHVLKEGDKFGYDYVAHIARLNFWAQIAYRSERIDGFFAAEVVNTGFYRDGKTMNGLFPDNSFGRSDKQSFSTPAVKAGLTYKLNGKNFLFANTAFILRAPYFEDAYLAARVQNSLTPGLTSEKISSIEGGYLMKAPRLKIRAVGYLTTFNDGVQTRSFFNESTNSFGNLTLSGIDMKNAGLELAAEHNFGKGISANTAASIGQFYYASRPNGTFTEDQSSTPLYTNETIYIKNLKVGGIPQTALTAGVSYRSPKFWLVNINVNYFDNIYIDFSPIRRTVEALDLLDAGSEQFEKILKQEKADAKLTVDAFFSWSYKINRLIKDLKRNSFFVINAGITNLLNEQNFKTGGFEQLRFDFRQQNPDKYPPKYFYAYGRTYFLSFIFRFN